MSIVRWKVLIAEDNRVLSDVMRFNLEKAGFACTVAPKGSTAMQLAGSERFDLLITDYQMPEANGEELCRHVRDALQLHDLPIIMCSAKGLELDTQRLREQLGVSRVIFKPFSMREIVSMASELVGHVSNVPAVGHVSSVPASAPNPAQIP
jgi:DNA-binding response OmpR family regulator